MADLIRARFLRKVLSEEAGRLMDAQTERIRKVLKERTGNLLSHRSARVFGSEGDFEGGIEIVHPAYERFLDMARLAGSEQARRRRIHNRPVMRTYYRIVDRLMTDFTEEMQASIREELEQMGKQLGG